MTDAQKTVVWVGVSLIVAAGVYPPWVSLSGAGGGLRRSIGYHWIFVPPTDVYATVDVPRLVILWVLVTVICAALLIAAPNLALSDQSWKRFRWFGRVVGGPVLTFAGLFAFLWLFGDRAGHKVPIGDAALVAVGVTLLLQWNDIRDWLKQHGPDVPIFLFVIGFAGFWAIAASVALGTRVEFVARILHQLAFERWAIPVGGLCGLMFLGAIVWSWLPTKDKSSLSQEDLDRRPLRERMGRALRRRE